MSINFWQSYIQVMWTWSYTLEDYKVKADEEIAVMKVSEKSQLNSMIGFIFDKFLILLSLK